MAICSPHAVNFKILQRIDNVNRYLFYVVLLFPLFQQIDIIKTSQAITHGTNFVYFWLILVYAALDFSISYYLFPEAESVRRCDYFQNSFGNKFIDNPSIGYFTNETLPTGIYKMGVNLFENAYFTTSIAREMLKIGILKSIFFATIFAYFSYEGFSRTEKFSIPFLQAFLSLTIIGGVLKLLLFYFRNKGILSNVRELFSSLNFKEKPSEYFGYCIKYYADYDSNLAWGGILLDSEIYKRINPILSTKWEKIKTDLNI
jgi:hypothetical protein